MKNIFKKLFMTKNKSCLSLVLGSFSALTMSPYCAFILFFISFPIMIYMFCSANNYKKSFLYGWLFGLGYFVFGLYWISNAIIDDFPYFVPFAILGLPMYLAIYTGFVGVITKLISEKTYNNKYLIVVAFSIAYVLMEVARGIIFTGFPWNLTVYTWTNYLPIMQGVKYFGIYGFSFISIFLFSLPYLFICKNKNIKTAVIFNLLGLVFLITLFFVGSSRIENNQQKSMFDKKVLVIQPAIPLKVSNLDSMSVFYEYYEMTMQNVTNDVDIIVWGETAIPFPINEYEKFLKKVSNVIPSKAILLTGSIRTDDNGNYYNSILAINSEGKIVGDYDKSHLVPFGEYMPLQDYINLEKIVGFDFIFSKGKGRKTIKIEEMPSFSPLVCYEAIFPNAIIDKDNKPEFIFNVSNDTFYKDTSGPYQHLGMVQAQAIATGLPVIRVGNNGISAIISPYGEIKGYIKYNKKAAVIMDF